MVMVTPVFDIHAEDTVFQKMEAMSFQNEITGSIELESTIVGLRKLQHCNDCETKLAADSYNWHLLVPLLQ